MDGILEDEPDTRAHNVAWRPIICLPQNGHKSFEMTSCVLMCDPYNTETVSMFTDV